MNVQLVLAAFEDLAEAHADLAVLVHAVQEHKDLYRAGAQPVINMATARVQESREALRHALEGDIT